MKYIKKLSEPCEFTEWKAEANDAWTPSYAALGGAVKTVLKHSLMDEQGYICCYCERRLTDDDSHIEHLRPQSDPLADALDYGNLLCSCQRSPASGEPLHCGVLKGSWYDSILLVSPLEPGCAERFAYTADGRIRPKRKSGAGASKTIAKLGLDIPKLRALRASVIEPFLDDELTVEEFQQFVRSYLDIDSYGAYGQFHTTIQHLFRMDV